jgi:hypothetical protein
MKDLARSRQSPTAIQQLSRRGTGRRRFAGKGMGVASFDACVKGAVTFHSVTQSSPRGHAILRDVQKLVQRGCEGIAWRRWHHTVLSCPSAPKTIAWQAYGF